MKSVATTLFSLLLLSALISSYLPSTTALIDTEGNLIYNGGAAYYILPAFPEIEGGGIELAKVGNETCPLSVAQAPSPFSNGAPLTISSNFRIRFLYEGLPLHNISFTSVPICSNNSSWWTNVEGSIKINSLEVPAGWFQIEKYSISYKLVYCLRPTGACKDVGIHIRDDGIRTLVLKDVNEKNPFVVKFEKAYDRSFATDA